MQREQKALEAYVLLHGHKLKGIVRSEPTAFLVHHTESGIPLDAKPTAYSIEHITAKFNTDDAAVRYLLHQMTTYDSTSCNILGLIFNNSTILAHVIQCGAVRED